MRLTLFTDYSLRVLLYVGLQPPEARVTIDRIAKDFHVSRNHLVKVVHQLALKGYILSQRGRGGGIRLARDPQSYRLGDLICSTEPDMHLVECFDEKNGTCPIAGACELESVLRDARKVFVERLNQKTLADLLKARSARETKKRLKIR